MVRLFEVDAGGSEQAGGGQVQRGPTYASSSSAAAPPLSAAKASCWPKPGALVWWPRSRGRLASKPKKDIACRRRCRCRCRCRRRNEWGGGGGGGGGGSRGGRREQVFAVGHSRGDRVGGSQWQFRSQLDWTGQVERRDAQQRASRRAAALARLARLGWLH
jgi:hypothetical protein